MLASVAVLALLAGSVATEASPGPKLGSADAVGMMHEFAQCLVKSRRARIEKVLAHPPQSKKAISAFMSANAHDCFRPGGEKAIELRMKDHLFRGALAEQMLLQDFGGLGVPAKREPAAIFAWPSPQELTSLDAEARSGMAMLQLGECVATAAPTEVYALFGTSPGSAAEKEAIRRLVPNISACLSAGQQLGMSAPSVRAFLAEGTYRLAVQGSQSTQQAQR